MTLTKEFHWRIWLLNSFYRLSSSYYTCPSYLSRTISSTRLFTTCSYFATWTCSALICRWYWKTSNVNLTWVKDWKSTNWISGQSLNTSWGPLCFSYCLLAHLQKCSLLIWQDSSVLLWYYQRRKATGKTISSYRHLLSNLHISLHASFVSTYFRHANSNATFNSNKLLRKKFRQDKC